MGCDLLCRFSWVAGNLVFTSFILVGFENMKTILFKDLISREPEDEVDGRALRVIQHYSSFDNLVGVIDRSFSTGFLLSPSPYSNAEVKCTGSFLRRFNFLKFCDEGNVFFIIQHNAAYCIGVWLPGDEILYVQNNSMAKDIVSNSFEVERASSDLNSPKEFLGFVNGYGRPYHYFYDRSPCLYSFVRALGSHKVKVLEDAASSFLSAELFGVSSENITIEHKLENVEGCYIVPSFPVGFKGEKESWRKAFDDFLLENVDPFTVHNHPLIWIGFSQEKRAFEGFYEAIVKFSIDVLEEFPGAAFVVDGLTRPSHIEYSDFKAKVSDELKGIEDMIVDVSNGVSKDVRNNFLSLPGAVANHKVSISSQVNFFLSNALTDSMWCAKFGRAPGMCWSGGNVERIMKEHSHPHTYFIPPDYGYTVKGEYSKESFVFDSYYIADVFLTGFKMALNYGAACFVEKCRQSLHSND